MKPIHLPLLAAAAILGAGCTAEQLPRNPWLDARTPDLPGNPHTSDAPVVTQTDHMVSKPSSPETSMRVCAVGNRILDANKQIGIRPLFMTVGLAKPEIGHQGTTVIEISEALVNACPDEGQLAAVLCSELGKMVAERQTKSNLMRRLRDRPEPTMAAVGGNAISGAPDHTDMAMNIKTYGDRPSAATAPAPPNPEVLAKSYLREAGYADTDFENVRDMLKAAEANTSLHHQISGK
jgi:hypothetical protein